MKESEFIYMIYFLIILIFSIIIVTKFCMEIGAITFIVLMLLNGIRGELMDINDYIKEQKNEKS